MIEPDVLLLDEPFLPLMPIYAKGCGLNWRIQRELGITTIFVTHDQAEAPGSF